MRQNFVAQFIQLLKLGWLCDVQLGVVMEKTWALFVDQCWLWVLQFSGHLIDLLSILLRCSGFAGIQKAVVDQNSSKPPVTMIFFFGASLAVRSALELHLGPTTELIIAGCHIKSTFHCTSQSN